LVTPRFLLDGMLGALARWLRICGYEAEYLSNASDEELMERASEGGLVLLTKDRLLYRKASRAGVDAFLVEGKDDTNKLASVSKRLELCLDPRRSRCPIAEPHYGRPARRTLGARSLPGRSRPTTSSGSATRVERPTGGGATG
jgi:uncharacterized protein with PIN domain